MPMNKTMAINTTTTVMKKIIYTPILLVVLLFASCEKDITYETMLEPEFPTQLGYEEVTIELPFNWSDWDEYTSGKPVENDTLELNYVNYKVNRIYKLTNDDQDTMAVTSWKLKMKDTKTGIMNFYGRNFAGATDREGKYAVDVLVNTSGTKTIFKAAWIFHLEKQ